MDMKVQGLREPSTTVNQNMDISPRSGANASFGGLKEKVAWIAAQAKFSVGGQILDMLLTRDRKRWKQLIGQGAMDFKAHAFLRTGNFHRWRVVQNHLTLPFLFAADQIERAVLADNAFSWAQHAVLYGDLHQTVQSQKIRIAGSWRDNNGHGILIADKKLQLSCRQRRARQKNHRQERNHGTTYVFA